MRNEYSRDELWRIVGGVPEEYAAVVSQRDALMATAKSSRWHAVHGSSVSRQTWDHIARGHNPPDDDTMLRFVEEAQAVADQAEEAWRAQEKASP